MSKLSFALGTFAFAILLTGCGKPTAPPRTSRKAVPSANYGPRSSSAGSSGVPTAPGKLGPTLADGYERAKRLDDAARRQVQRSIDAKNRRRAHRAKLKVYPTVTPRKRARLR